MAHMGNTVFRVQVCASWVWIVMGFPLLKFLNSNPVIHAYSLESVVSECRA